jgi:hypothetical protein
MEIYISSAVASNNKCPMLTCIRAADHTDDHTADERTGKNGDLYVRRRKEQSIITGVVALYWRTGQKQEENGSIPSYGLIARLDHINDVLMLVTLVYQCMIHKGKILRYTERFFKIYGGSSPHSPHGSAAYGWPCKADGSCFSQGLFSVTLVFWANKSIFIPFFDYLIVLKIKLREKLFSSLVKK